MMERPSRICTLLLALFLIASFVQLRPAQGSFYRYVDRDGIVHFTDNLDSIPEEYRNQIKIYKEEATPKPTPLEAGVTEEKGDKRREAEERKEAEAKALREKVAREEKLKERQEIQERINGLQEQIRAKQEEQGSLRTTWMVYDRIRLNQLNAEIAALGQEIQSLQQELAAKGKE